MSAKDKKMQATRVADEIMEGLTELQNAVQEGRPLVQAFTVKTVDLVLTPKMMDAEAIRLLRVTKLKASQAVFAAVLGVSAKLVESWEQGKRQPKPWALRLMHVFSDSPELFYKQIELKHNQICHA